MRQIQTAGFFGSGLLCLLCALLKLTVAGHWSWWRVLLPLWAVLGHNALYLAVGFVWLWFAEVGATEEVTLRPDPHPYGYQLMGLLCFLLFTDHLLGRLEGQEQTASFWWSSGCGELIIASGLLSVVCQMLFWSSVVRSGPHRSRVRLPV
jgi:hypothetical protein